MAARSAPLWDPKKSEFLLESEMYLLSLSQRLSQHLDNAAENEIHRWAGKTTSSAVITQHRTWLSSVHYWQHAETMVSNQETIRMIL